MIQLLPVSTGLVPLQRLPVNGIGEIVSSGVGVSAYSPRANLARTHAAFGDVSLYRR